MKRFISVMCCLSLLAILLCSCNDKKPEVSTQTEKETKTVEEMLEIVVGGKAKYGIVRDEDISTAGLNACTTLFSAIYDKTGVRVPFITDEYTLEDGMKEILVGNTSREESQQVMGELEKDEYAIKVVGEAIVIAATDDASLFDAVNKFISEYVASASNGELKIDKNIDVEGVADLSNATYVRLGGRLTSTAKTMTDPKIDMFYSLEGGNYSLTWMQGGCVKGDYLYTCITTDNSVSPRKCVIVKSDMKTGEVLEYGREMELGHANDMTYNPDDNVFVVADCGEKSSRIDLVFVIDADTLEIKESVKVNEGTVVSIDYDTVNKRYVAIGYQNNYFYIYDRDFKLVEKYEGAITNNYSAQGILTDGTYLYMLEYWQNPNDGYDIRNNLRVFNLSNGKCEATINLGIAREAEFITYWNGNLYVGCNKITWKGLDFFKVEIG